MADIDLAAIRARALAAGGAEAKWRLGGPPGGYQCERVEDGRGVVVYDEGAPTEEQAAHIAGMDPATTLALLDLIDAVRAG